MTGFLKAEFPYNSARNRKHKNRQNGMLHGPLSGIKITLRIRAAEMRLRNAPHET